MNKEEIKHIEKIKKGISLRINNEVSKLLFKYIKELEQKETILDKVTDTLKERIKELDKQKENYIKLKEYDQVDFTLCKKREVQNILNIIEGEKK